MNYEVTMIKSGIIVSIVSIVFYLISGNKSSLFIILLTIPLILINLFKIKNYDIKMYYISISFIIILQGLTLIYFYLYDSIYTKNPLYYFLITGFIFLIVNFVYYYPKRKESTKLQ